MATHSAPASQDESLTSTRRAPRLRRGASRSSALAICAASMLCAGCGGAESSAESSAPELHGSDGGAAVAAGDDLDLATMLPAEDLGGEVAFPHATPNDALRVAATGEETMAAFSGTPRSTDPYWFYRPEIYTGALQDRLTYAGTPLDTTMFHVYGLGRAADKAIPWNVGEFTGFDVPKGELSTHQRGYDPSSFGTTSFQMYGSSAGFMLNSRQLPLGYQGGGGAHLTYHFSNRNPVTDSPWRKWGPSTRVRLQFNATINHFSSTSPDCIPYLPGALVLVTQGATFQWVFGAWDGSLGAHGKLIPEYVHKDTGTAMINVSTYFTSTTKYASSEPNSKRTFGVADDTDHWFAGYIDGAHIAEVARAYNDQADAQGKPHVSTNPANYAVAFISVGPEWRVRNPKIGICHFGVNIHNMALIAYVPPS